MSLFSRLFQKAPTPTPPESPPPEKARPSADERALAAIAEESALRSAVAAGDVQAVARLVVEGSSTKVRQAAAHAVEDPEVLRRLIRDVRGGKDNNVYKVLTAKRDVLLEQARKLEQQRAEIDASSADLEHHSKRPYDALFGPRLEQPEIRWNAVAEQADPELRGRVQQWIDRSRETIAGHARQVAEKAAREQAAAEAAAEARRVREQEEQAAAAAAAEQARIIEEQERALFEQHQAEQQLARQVGELIRKARIALGEGSTSRAAGVRRALEEKLAGVSPVPAKLASQIQQLDKQLDELKDWKSFTVAPKRTELIEEMESLIGATLTPEALAEKIKSLQEDWRTLSKGAGENVEADWQRFQDAAKKAYEPCKEHFAAQALARAENLRHRDALLARLAEFEAGHDWERPDWQAVTKVLRETKQEWRRYSDVEHRAGRQQHHKFSAAVASLQGRLDAEHARNVKQKESLIERARALLTSEDSRKAIDAAKQLQQQWRAVGPVPREVDQRLWGDFRQHCDAVFQKREQEFAAHSTALENNKAQAVAVCEQVEAIATLEGTELQERAKGVPELRKAFEALGEFPRADSRALRTRLDRALDRCAEALARQRARDAERGWVDLFEAAGRVRAYRLAVVHGMDQAQLDALKAAAESSLAAGQRWPKGGLDALRQSLAAERSADLAANEAALRMLCVRAEILADLPTPAEDQTLRRDLQLQRLVEKMGQGLKAVETKDTLAFEWVRTGPVEEATYAPLLARFLRCRNGGKAV